MALSLTIRSVPTGKPQYRPEGELGSDQARQTAQILADIFARKWPPARRRSRRSPRPCVVLRPRARLCGAIPARIMPKALIALAVGRVGRRSFVFPERKVLHAIFAHQRQPRPEGCHARLDGAR